VENMCATGSESLRQACYAVASGAFDCVMAIGVEKLKDSGFSGLVVTNPPNDGTPANMTPPALFSLLAPAYFKKYGLDPEKGRDVLARIAWKNHKNGARNPKAQFQKEVPIEAIKNSPKIADPLCIMDCSGVSDGAAAAIVVRAEDAHKYCKNPIYIKALSFVAGPAEGPLSQEYDFTTFPEVVATARDAYAQAGITNPREQVSLAEVHDCFTPTELVLYEDLGFSPRGTAWSDVLEGFFELEGKLPVNPDGGLKSFGHPIGASGLRMMYEMWLQLRGEAGPRQINNPKVGLTHNLGGQPGRCVSFVSVVGSQVG
ncbi:MAG: acetyl-CoA acetyltransferase, partial [Deltaproteobacteria bacterium]|nr:acetyl-CoA acetyltransferase [Deltaproteobacteria bacterium]